MVAKRPQAPCSSMWAKSCQCPVVDSRLFSASSDVLRGAGGHWAASTPGSVPTCPGWKGASWLPSLLQAWQHQASLGQLAAALLLQKCWGVGWAGAVLGVGVVPGGSSR